LWNFCSSADYIVVLKSKAAHRCGFCRCSALGGAARIVAEFTLSRTGSLEEANWYL
jgi:hypothetical protein